MARLPRRDGTVSYAGNNVQNSPYGRPATYRASIAIILQSLQAENGIIAMRVIQPLIWSQYS